MNMISLYVLINKISNWWDCKSNDFKISIKIINYFIQTQCEGRKKYLSLMPWFWYIFSKFCELSFYSSEKFNLFCLLCLPFSQSSHVFTWQVWNNGLRNNVSIPYWMGLDHLIISCFTSSLNQDTKTWFQIFA